MLCSSTVIARVPLSLFICLFGAACSSPSTVNRENDLSDGGRAVTRVSISDDGMDDTLGVSSADIQSMTDRMVASMLSNPRIASQTQPIVVIDAKYMKDNAGGGSVSLDLLATRIRLGLKTHANDRMVFVAADEGSVRLIAEEGIVAGDGVRIRIAANFRMIGSVDSHSGGGKSRYMLFTFELVDTRNGEIVWSDRYEFKKVRQ